MTEANERAGMNRPSSAEPAAGVSAPKVSRLNLGALPGGRITAVVLLVVALIIAGVTGQNFLSLHNLPYITPGSGVSRVAMLSDYSPELKGSHGDTPIYVMEGAEPGGKMLLIGGTHPNEPSGHLGAVLFLQNAKVTKGTVYVIPYANRSAFTHNDPQEAAPQALNIPTPQGNAVVRYGSRATNPIDSWPDPDVYIHTSGQKLSGSETRNLNRAYPGRIDGTFTERVTYAITNLIQKEGVNLTFDLHESSPEYPVNNATVAHEKAMNIAAEGVINLQSMGIEMSLEPSPSNLHGLTHRELGDYTDTYPLLMETPNASQGRLRGVTDEASALTGIDPMYVYAARLGFVYVPYDEKGHPIEERVGRHLEGIIQYTAAYTNQNPEMPIEFENVPTYEQLFASEEGAPLGGSRLGQFMLPTTQYESDLK